MKKINIYLLALVVIFGIIGYTASNGNIIKEFGQVENVQIQKNSDFQTVRFQTANVPCRDTENYGRGSNRSRVCAHGQEATCGWENWNPPASLGNCTIGSDLEVC